MKQFDKFSFSRVFQSGHAVNAYQPETVDRIFQRTILGVDVATGQKNASDGYSSEGPTSSLGLFNGTLPDTPPTCMIAGAFQDASPWTDLFALMAAGGSDGNGTNSGSGNGSQSGSGNDSGSNNNGTSSSMSAKLQPAGFLALGLFVVAGFGNTVY